jgi:uncharacterized protein (TIGR02996 family)
MGKWKATAEEEALIQAILAAPADRAARLVYADWLEERGDARADYLRQELALAGLKRTGRKAKELRASLQELRSRIEPAWLAVFDRPAVMRANPTPYPAGWWGTELEGYRDVDATYGAFAYEKLPPAPAEALRGDFRWLREGGERQAARAAPSKKLQRLTKEARQLGLALPRELGVLMDDLSLRKRVRSCTDCFFNWPKRLAEAPGGEGGHLLRFYSDSQGCLHWYLYLTPRRYCCVVASGQFYGGREGMADFEEEDEEPAEMWFCAPSLEEFVYRTWIENEIWYALEFDHDPLTTEEQAYLSHYSRSRE